MPEPPSSVNSRESKHRLANIKLTEKEHLKQSTSSFNLHQHKRILIVDDNSDIAFTLQIGLENNDTTMHVYSYDNPVNALIDFEPNFYYTYYHTTRRRSHIHVGQAFYLSKCQMNRLALMGNFV
ncbi:MAG: hypothetical protein ACRD8W_26545 [Nitrososphaeraceae archaeon]